MTCGAFSKKYNVFVKGIGIAALLFKEKLLYKFELFFCCVLCNSIGHNVGQLVGQLVDRLVGWGVGWLVS